MIADTPQSIEDYMPGHPLRFRGSFPPGLFYLGKFHFQDPVQPGRAVPGHIGVLAKAFGVNLSELLNGV
jgi:hypothetical protein